MDSHIGLWHAASMPERSSMWKKKDHDFAIKAFQIVQEAMGEVQEPTEAAPESLAPRDNGKTLLPWS